MTEIEQMAERFDYGVRAVEFLAAELRRHAYGEDALREICGDFAMRVFMGTDRKLSFSHFRLACQRELFNFYPELL